MFYLYMSALRRPRGIEAWLLKLMEDDIQIVQLTFKVISHLYYCRYRLEKA